MCGTLVAERATYSSDADQAQMMRRIHEEAEYARNELREAQAGNEQLTYNVKETIAGLAGGTKTAILPSKAGCRGVSPGFTERRRGARASAP